MYKNNVHYYYYYYYLLTKQFTAKQKVEQNIYEENKTRW